MWKAGHESTGRNVPEGLCHYLDWINPPPELAARLVTHPMDRLDCSVTFGDKNTHQHALKFPHEV